MAKATKRNPAEAIASAASIAPTSSAATTDMTKTAPRSPWDNLSGDQKAEALSMIGQTRDAFAELSRSEHSVALMIGTLRDAGFHTLAKYGDFAAWVEDASGGTIPRSKAGRYDQAAQTLEACECNPTRAAQAKTLSIDTLAKIAGKAKKSAAGSGLSAEEKNTVREANARQSVAAYADARSSGKTAKDAEVAAGIASAPATVTLDHDGKVSRIVNLAASLAGKSHTDTINLLQSALDSAKRQREKAREVAAEIRK